MNNIVTVKKKPLGRYELSEGRIRELEDKSSEIIGSVEYKE